MNKKYSRNKLCVLLALILIPCVCSCTHTTGQAAQQAAPNFQLSVQFTMPLEGDSSDGKSAEKPKKESELSSDEKQPPAAAASDDPQDS